MAALAMFAALLVDPVRRPLAIALLPAIAGGAIFLGAERYQLAHARAWRWMGFGLGLLGLGHVMALLTYASLHLTLGVVPTVAGYACLVAGAMLFSRSTGLRDDIAILDAGIIGLALALMIWHLLIEPSTSAGSPVGPVVTALAIARPVADVLVNTIVLPFAINGRGHRAGAGGLAAAFGCFALADAQTGAATLSGVPDPSGAQLASVIATVLVIFVTLDRDRMNIGSVAITPSPKRDLLRTAGVSCAVLVPPVLLLSSAAAELDADRVFETAAGLVLAFLVVARLHRTVRALGGVETQFRQLMAYPGLLAVIKDDQGRYRFMSDTAEANNGLSGVPWYGKTDADLFDPETAQFRGNLDVDARRTGEIQVRTFDVGPRTWHTEKFLLRDLPGWIGVIGVDITERVRAIQRRDALEQELTKIDQAIARDTERRAAERSLVREALASLRPGDSPETTAESVCRALASVPEFSHGVVIAFERGGLGNPAGDVLALVTHGGHPAYRRPLPAERVAYLRDRAIRGPWVERWLADRRHPYRELIDELHVAAHAYAPIVADGRLVGLLVVGSADPGALVRLTEWLPGLTEFADIAGAVIGPALIARASRGEAMLAMRSVIDGLAFAPVFQPIVDLRSGAALGFEALTRFDDGTPPDMAFEAAHQVGLGDELEIAAVRLALEAARALPEGAWLNVNTSPSVLERSAFRSLVAKSDRELVIEITEHAEVSDYGALRAAFARLDGRARLCIDDAGAGFASLRHVVELGPAFVKLDRSLVAGVDRDPARQAAVAGLVHYASVAGVRLVAEGIEEPAELEVLKSLGIVFGQGYLLGRPAPIAELTGAVPVRRRPPHPRAAA